jgi:hypothetical protein
MDNSKIGAGTAVGENRGRRKEVDITVCINHNTREDVYPRFDRKTTISPAVVCIFWLNAILHGPLTKITNIFNKK